LARCWNIIYHIYDQRAGISVSIKSYVPASGIVHLSIILLLAYCHSAAAEAEYGRK
jgi:hypothetical protein